MLGNGLHAQGFQQAIEQTGGRPLEVRITVPAAPHAIHDVRAVLELLQHEGDGGDVVLEISVDRYHGISVRCVEPGDQRCLVAPVA